MAPRMSKGKRKFDFDDFKFVNMKAQVRFNSNLCNKKCVQDQAFEKTGGEVEQIIVDKHWEHFCYYSADAAANIVWEFYSNMCWTDPNEPVLCRGRMVEFTPERINAFYQLRDERFCEYKNFGTMDAYFDEVITFLTDGKGVWKTKMKQKVNFSASALNVNSKAWHYFISGRLIPTYHHSEVTRDRAVLNYCIQKRKMINIGVVIYNNIRTVAKSETTGGLGHPALIHALCIESGVELEDEEEWVHPLKPISKTNIRTYESHESWRTGSRGKEIPSGSDIPSASQDAPSSSRIPTLSDIMDQLMIQGGDIKKIHKKISKMEARNDYNDEYLQRRVEYDTAYHEAQMRFIRGERQVIFPTCPRFTPYEPQEPEPEEEAEEEDWEI